LESGEAGLHRVDRCAAIARLLRQFQADYGIDAQELREVVLSTSLPIPSRDSERDAPSQNQEGDQGNLSLRIRCLGNFCVQVSGQTIDHWRSSRARSVLKYLITRGRRPVSKDVLMEALWPGWDPPHANDNLKAAVRTLREALGSACGRPGTDSWVLYRGGSYLLNPEVDLWVDVEQFESHWQAGRQLEKEARVDEAVSEFESAVKLYGGDYLEDDLYEDWTLLHREGLKDTYLAMLGRLADHSLRTADYHGCIAYCQKILLKDHCREDAFQRLICCHSRLGQRNRAITWYRLCEATVRSELGIEPSAPTVRLYQRLLGDEHV